MQELPKLLQGKNHYAEGGRMCYFYAIYIIARNMMTEDERWPKTANLLIHTKDHQVRWYFVAPDEKPFTKLLKVFTDDSETELSELEQVIRNVGDRFSEMLREKDVSHLEAGELAALFSEYMHQCERLISVAGALRYIDRGAQIELKHLLGNKYTDELLRMVTQSDRDAYIMREESDVLRIAAMAQECGGMDHGDVQQAVSDLVTEFAHGVLGYFEETPTTRAEYEARIMRAMQGDPQGTLTQKQTERNETLAAKRQLLETLSEEVQIVSHVAAESTFLKDLFKYILNHGTHLAEPLWAEMAKRTGKPTSFLKDLSTVENVALLEGNSIDEEYVQARTEDGLLLSNATEYTEYVGDEAEYIRANFLAAEHGALKGRSACPGQAKGTVRIILSSNDFHKMQDGDVLVAINTSPDYTPIMKRATAILTEEGGITSHASVVSREMNVPCIVGISNVTERLHDGDIVEVDADKGIVKKVTNHV